MCELSSAGHDSFHTSTRLQLLAGVNMNIEVLGVKLPAVNITGQVWLNQLHACMCETCFSMPYMGVTRIGTQISEDLLHNHSLPEHAWITLVSYIGYYWDYFRHLEVMELTCIK